MEVELKEVNKKIARYKIGIILEIILIIIMISVYFIFFNNGERCNEEQNRSMPNVFEQFNAPFLNYAGIQGGTQIKSLVNNINIHNIEYSDTPELQITINSIIVEADNEIAFGVEDEYKESTKPNFIRLGKYLDDNIRPSGRYQVTLDYYYGDPTENICNIRIVKLKK